MLLRKIFEELRVRDVMTPDVITVYANQQMRTAAEKLQQCRITGAPVVSYDEICVGVISSKDFLRQQPAESDDDQVFTHMTSPALTISKDEPLMEVARMLFANRIHRVPVVDDYGHVVGILSTLDIVGQLVKVMEQEAEPVTPA